LKAGAARVRIDDIFAQTVETSVPYHVFVTPNGNCGLYVSEKTSESFKVSRRDGDSACEFDYRIVAKRKNYERVRLAELTEAPGGDSVAPSIVLARTAK
jgi:hypothetical protein